MDSVIDAASRELAGGKALVALKRVALRNDAPALALRGIAMAQLGDLDRSRELLRAAARAFGSGKPLSVARCRLAAAEIALVSRDLGGTSEALAKARASFIAHGDQRNAAHSAYLQARLALLLGRIDEAESCLGMVDLAALPQVSRGGYWLVVAGIAIRRIQADAARAAFDHALDVARRLSIPSLSTEVDAAIRKFDAPAACLVADGCDRMLSLAEVEAWFASGRLIVDASRNVVRRDRTIISLGRRPILFGLLRVLAEAWPHDVPRDELLKRVFRARHSDESHRARLRVEMARLRKEISPFANITATGRGFVLAPHDQLCPAVLAPPVEEEHADLLGLMADGEAWSSSGLALALDVSPRTTQRALETLHRQGKVEWFGRGRARRWIISKVPGFPINLLLSSPLPSE
ncbi:helix-turn-helix domain-containing protein [Paracoccus aestuariivivens]|uniref:Helix-turn-helix domain-containing protein n=2 Tax=Paracoccus aestuariivivens TaxID=1820333 RepID=A0A6L6JBP5_9RHOB|nr:helix-turn-helix domain-containing protein [Paracoccus aestuariivivens]